MPNTNKYKVEIRKTRWNSQEQQKEVIPLPVDKVTGISWKALVKVIAEDGVENVKEIRLHNVGQKGGTAMLARAELLRLWKCVEAFRATANRMNQQQQTK
jgi:hypothetical protein